MSYSLPLANGLSTIFNSEDAAIDVTESGRIVVVYECNQGTLCLGRDMGHIASLATIESTGDVVLPLRQSSVKMVN